MSLTRANIESVLIRRVGKLLAAADLDGTTVSGSNGDLNDPIGWAIRQCGGTVASVVSVADGDCASVDDTDVDKLLDLAELRTLETIEGNLDGVDITVGPRSESLNQLSVRVRMKLDAKRDQVRRDYGFNVATLSAGVVTLDFAQTGATSE
jgi:hypothetical protein